MAATPVCLAALTLTVIDLGDGTVLLTPRASRVSRSGDRVADILKEEGLALEDLLSALDEERESNYRQNYPRD